MNNFEELLLNLKNLCNKGEVKINVHYKLNGALLDLCEKINNDVNKVSTGLISFRAKNITIPHLSLYMGYVNSFEQIEMVLEHVSEYAKKNKKIRIDPTRIYWKSKSKISSNYLFLDLLQNEEIHIQKRYFCNLFQDKVKPMEWDFEKENPHITVGCYEHVTPKAKNQIEKYHEYPYCIINEVGVSISGNKGVCLGHLKTFELRNL